MIELHDVKGYEHWVNIDAIEYVIPTFDEDHNVFGSIVHLKSGNLTPFNHVAETPDTIMDLVEKARKKRCEVLAEALVPVYVW